MRDYVINNIADVSNGENLFKSGSIMAIIFIISIPGFLDDNDMSIEQVAPGIHFISLDLPLPGYNKFIASYLICGEKKVIVDTGPAIAVPSLISSLAEAGINPDEIDYIILTHIHIDHAGGAGQALRQMKQAKVIAHPRAQTHLANPQRLWQASITSLGDTALQYGNIEPIPKERIIPASDLMTLELGNDKELTLYFTPGHAPHHLSVFSRSDKLIIAGEAAGVCLNGVIRPTAPSPFKKQETINSIDRLIALKPELICYAHVGCYDQALAKLHTARKQLLDWQQMIKTLLEEGNQPAEILDILRKQDQNLQYLDNLDQAQYEREHKLLTNTIAGMIEALKYEDG
jgi:glyoxylase-like metal-dependent hydrolase (beta-lactamase superfamily II)